MELLDMLGKGELPVIKVEIQKSTIVNFAVAMVIVLTIFVLLSYFFKKSN